MAMTVKQHVKQGLTAAILLALASALGSCGGGGSPEGFSAYVADHWPHWAGGMPDDVPPRPGAPGYNEFISHGGANQGAAQSANAPAPEFVATGSATSNGKPPAGAAKTKSKVQPAIAAQTVSPQQPPRALPSPEPPPQEIGQEPDREPDQEPGRDSSVVKGGLY
jgi:hypothetical protein